MDYEIEIDDIVYFYHVTYDTEKLREILDELKKYSYVCVCQAKVGSFITKWPATDKIIKKRIELFDKSTSFHKNHTINYDSIVHHKEKNNDYVTYEYSYNKLPDLHDFIDLLINDDKPGKYTNLFGNKINNFTFLYKHDQLMLDGLFNYINSPELTYNNNEDYDYKGLNELYKKTLESFKFNLVAIKEKVNNQEEVDGISLQKKKMIRTSIIK